MAVSAPTASAGCPSGLAPASDTARASDPGVFAVQLDTQTSRLELIVKGARCAGCIRKIESALLALPGVDDARLNLSTSRLRVAWRNGALQPRTIVQTLIDLGYEANAFDPESAKRETDQEGRFLLRCMAVAAFATMNVMMFTVPVWSSAEMGDATRATMHLIAAIIAVPSALYAGQPFFRSAWRALRTRHANMDVPISIAVLLTLIMSVAESIAGGPHAYFDGVVMLLFLLLIGRWLDHELREKARTAAKELLAVQAVAAHRIAPGGAVTQIRASDIAIGDRLQIAAGDRSPVDALVEDGVSEVDESLLTGESLPRPLRAGDVMAAGVINLTRPLIVRATSTAHDSTVAELARLVEQGEQRRSGFMRMADRAAQLYVPIVHGLALMAFLGWLWFGAATIREALLIACAVLIITCPCALGLAAPAVQIVATGRLFKRGVLVKSGDALERLAQIDKVLLDKTGTLTLGRPVLTNGAEIAPDTLAAAAQLARASRHPLSRALVQAAGPGFGAKDVLETPGMGVAGVIDNQSARLGSAAFVGAEGKETPKDRAVLWFSWAGRAPVMFTFMDALRSDAKNVVHAMQARGLEPEILSGDRAAAVAAAAEALGIAHATGEAKPADKSARLNALSAQGRHVLMIGDGLNDAPALALAHASASPGAAIDAAQAAADIVFQGEKLGAVLDAIDVARIAQRRMVENFAFAALYNVIAVPIAVAGLVTPLIAAAAMAGSSLVVTLNALRLAERAKPTEKATTSTLGGAAWTSPSS
jgi:Cu2+-exporting ATPase